MGHNNYAPGKPEQFAYVKIAPNLSAFERAMGGRPKVRRGSMDRVRAVVRAAEMAGEALRSHAEVVRNVQKFLINNGLIEPPPPEDKWERALWLRDHRNTGPPTPAAWHRRNIAPTKARARRARGPVNQRRRRSYEFHS